MMFNKRQYDEASAKMLGITAAEMARASRCWLAEVWEDIEDLFPVEASIWSVEFLKACAMAQTLEQSKLGKSKPPAKAKSPAKSSAKPSPAVKPKPAAAPAPSAARAAAINTQPAADGQGQR